MLWSTELEGEQFQYTQRGKEKIQQDHSDYCLENETAEERGARVEQREQKGMPEFQDNEGDDLYCYESNGRER